MMLWLMSYVAGVLCRLFFPVFRYKFHVTVSVWLLAVEQYNVGLLSVGSDFVYSLYSLCGHSFIVVQVV